eukprot:gene3479-13539_t
MEGMGLEVYVSHFDMEGGLSQCTNVHAILRAPRGDGKESLVVVTPIDFSSGQRSYLGGAGCQLWNTPELTSMGASIPNSGSAPDAVPFGRAGVMQQAVIIEIPFSSQFDSIEVLVEGFNGALPKLDMLQLLAHNTWILHPKPAKFVRAMRHGRQAQVLPLGLSKQMSYIDRLRTMLYFTLLQARGLPTGAHAALKGLLVDAATARLIPLEPGIVQAPSKHSGGHEDLRSALRLGEYLELVLRSLNNLTERFHHSYFLYLLTSAVHFVTIEMYIIPVAALIAVLLLQAASARWRIIDLELQANTLGGINLCSTASPGAKPKGIDQSRSALRGWAWAWGLVLGTCTACGLLAVLLPVLWGCPGEAASIKLWLFAISDSPTGPSAQGVGVLLSIGIILIAPFYDFLGAPALASSLQVDAGGSCAEAALGSSLPPCAVGSSSESKDGAGLSDGSKLEHLPQAQSQCHKLRLRAATLSSAAVALAALSCINWALAYLLAAMLALTCSAGVHAPRRGGSAEKATSRQWGTSVGKLLILFLTSPLVHVLMVCWLAKHLNYTEGSTGSSSSPPTYSLLGELVPSDLVCSRSPTTWLSYWITATDCWGRPPPTGRASALTLPSPPLRPPVRQVVGATDLISVPAVTDASIRGCHNLATTLSFLKQFRPDN